MRKAAKTEKLAKATADIKAITAEAETLSNYEKLLQGAPTNAIVRAGDKDFIEDEITGESSANINGVRLIKQINELQLAPSVAKVLDIAVIKLGKNLPHVKPRQVISAETIDRNRSIELSVREYMELCGLSDYKSAKAQLESAVRNLYNLSLEWEEDFTDYPEGSKKPRRTTTKWKTRIFDSVGESFAAPVKRGKVSMKFTMDMAKYFTQAPAMEFNDNLFQINPKLNPNSYPLGRKLSQHYHMNQHKENGTRISVRALLGYCPSIPTYEEVMSGGKHLTQRIIEPFERDLLALYREVGFLIDWHYCKKNGEPIPEKELEAYTYDDWIEWLVEFELPEDYPHRERTRGKSKK